MKNIAHLSVLAFVTWTAPAVTAQAGTLSDSLVSAYQNSGLIRQNRALLRAADEDVALATASLRPVISFLASSNYLSASSATVSSLGLSVNMLLTDFGRSHLRRDVAKENVLGLRQVLISVEQSVLLRAVVAYTGVRRDIAIANLRSSNVRLIEQELQAARDRFEVGQITRTDVAIAQARLAAAQSGRAAASGNLAISREEYRAAVGDYPSNLVRPPAAPRTVGSLQEALAIARLRHPDMKQAQHSVAITDLNVGIVRSAIMPALTGTAAVSVDQDGQDSGSVGLSFGGPVYQGGALASAARKAAAQRDAARAGLHMTRAAVEQNVAIAWARKLVAEASLAASEQQIRASRTAFRGVREEASLGARTTLDVLNAEQELLDAEAAQISAETARYVAVYNLLASMGLLTVEHLKLGVVTYDPVAYYDAVKSAPTGAISVQGQRLESLLQSLGKK